MTIRTIDAPLPGVFYIQPSPDARPFKQPGDLVSPGETIGLIEVMKSFMPIHATETGRLVRYLVAGETEVDVGHCLCEIEI